MEQTEANLYHELTEVEKLKIQEKAQGLTSLLSIWASQFPIIRDRRAAPVAALVSTVLPDLPPHLALLVGKIILFIFAVDDVADERLLSYSEFVEAGKAWEAIARYGTAPQPVEKEANLSVVIWEIRQELLQIPLFSGLHDLWADRLRSLCDAMAKEYQYGLRYSASGKELLPEWEAYVQGGIHSVGFPFWGTSVLILLNEPELRDRLDLINEIMLQTGGAIRLYNDFRTNEKEVQEGNINGITIVEAVLRKKPGLSPLNRFVQAQDTVLSLAVMYDKKSRELVGGLHSGTGRLEKMIRRILDFHAYFYGSRLHSRDYHTISTSETIAMIRGE
jgi:hypothetical protein